MTKIIGFGALAGLLAFIGWGLYSQALMLNGFIMMFRASPAIWMLILIGVAGLCLMAYSYDSRRASEGAVGLGLAMACGALLGVVVMAFMGNYQKAHATHNSVEVLAVGANGEAQMADYNYRAPFVVAREQTDQNVNINGKEEDTFYVPATDHFGALVVKAGTLKGYGQIVWQQIGATGQAKVNNCAFSDEAQRRLDGSFSHNLNRAILHKSGFGLSIDKNDSYGYCTEDGTPMVVVPLTTYKGFWFPIRVPGGVATYNGKTGEIKVYDSVKDGQIPGPVYPLSLSENQRHSTSSANGLWAWLTHATGYQDYGGENSGDYTLRKTDSDDDSYVTPLTMKGNGKAIVAVGYTDSNGFTKGELNPYKIAKLPVSRQGDSAVSSQVKADYSDLSWASGLEVFEIIPTGPNQWMATIGLRKAITYRLTINADNTSCLYTTSNVKIRCSGDSSTGTSETPGDKAATLPKDLTTLTNDQLLQLQRQVMEVIQQRMAPTPTAKQ